MFILSILSLIAVMKESHFSIQFGDIYIHTHIYMIYQPINININYGNNIVACFVEFIYCSLHNLSYESIIMQ